MQIPQSLIDFRIYNDETDLLGVADAEMPSLEWLTETIGGAGVAGEAEMPLPGLYKPMTIKFKWRVWEAAAVTLAKSQAHHLDCRGSVQQYDAGSGDFKNYAVKLVVKSVPKKLVLGKFETGKAQGTESEFECVYLKLWIGDKEMIEIDKFNYISKVDGEDDLAEVRSHLGIE